MLERLSQIDKLTRPDHHLLTPDDLCLYYGDYTARMGYAHSDTNQLISNLKKSVTRRGMPDYRYKAIAIEQVARAIVRDSPISEVTFVPVPPSKIRTHPEYDDRMVQVLRRCQQLQDATDFRELVVQTQSTVAMHASDNTRRPETLEAIYQIYPAVTANVRGILVVVDDVLTTGCHYVAMRNVLARAFPGREIAGLFVARRVPQAEDVESAFPDLL